MSHAIWKRNAGSALVLAVLLGVAATSAQGKEQELNSLEPGQAPMYQLDMGGPAHVVDVTATKDDVSPFIRDAKFSAQLRSYYLKRENYDSSYNEAWALGGSVGLKSGYAGGWLAVGAVAYTSQPLYAPDGRDGTLLLQPGQDGYTVLGQIYAEIKFSESVFGAIGRKEYNTPYLNKNDSRMTPNTFEGGSIYGTHKDGSGGQWKFGGGYLTKIKERNSDEFVWLSRDAGANVDRGLYVAGANYQKGDMSIGAANYYSDDIINIFYTEAKYGFPLTEAMKLKLGLQYSDQRSTGGNLLTGADFSTNQWGLKGDLNVGAALFTMAYTSTANGDNMRSPWGIYPGYTSVQVEDFNRAGESAVLIRASYDLAALGLEGLSVYALWVDGSGVKGPLYNQNEGDLNLQWTPKSGAWKGTSIRVRYAKVYQQGGGDPEKDDFRIIFNYDF